MRRRLLLSYLSLTLFVLVVLEVPLGVIFARRQLAELTAEVERDAVVTATLVEDTLEAGRPLDGAAVTRYAEETGARVVVVDAGGRALVDSSGDGTGRSFANRPEVAEALAGRVATGSRRSATLGADLLYVAVPVASSGTVYGAVRITYPTSALDGRVRRSWLTLAGVAAVSLATAGGLAVALAGSVSRPLRRLEAAAADIGRGHLSARAPTDAGPPEVRALAREINDTAERLTGLLAAQDAFVADASHQLRSPLTALRLRLENLAEELDPDSPMHGDARAAVAEMQRLSRIVDGLLALARADRAAGEPPAAVVDPTAVLEERRAAWSALAEERALDLVVEAGEGPAAPVRATTDRLVQVLDNLLANAFDAAPPGTTVTLRAEPAADGARVDLHVLDRGPGLTPDERRRAFDRFWRGGTSSAGAGNGLGGSGLGLSIVHRLVVADGGEVELLPRPDGGTDAVVHLHPAP